MKTNPDPLVDKETAKNLGLTDAEYEQILKILGRVPSYTELGIYSVMWSEHCSYKNSIALLKTLPRTGKRLLVGAGEENAGLVDIGDGLAVAFKIESHNHPSAVEPYQGAATGVGGILRDIFTMGARPIAALNSLRFGNINDPATQHLVKGVVKGIGDYGNSFGVPTVAGEVYFDPCYQSNPLVNAMAIGIVEHQHVASAIAKGEGNSVMYVGSSTGRDGIHGATFASEEISEASESKRPSVQVGDPFTEKLLLEATLEVIKAGYVIGIQDMGAAGLTCSTMEMSAKGRSGMVIDLDLVPTREENMTAYEIMLSESQERMLLVAKPGMETDIQKIYSKWDLHCVTIGRVTDDGRVKVFLHNDLMADVPAESLVLGGGAPVYIRETKYPIYLNDVRAIDCTNIPQPDNLVETIYQMLRSPNITGKKWVFEQYDSMVRDNTIDLPGSDAAVVKLKGTGKYLASKTDCNARYVYLNPKRGAEIAVAESARNVVCSGAMPLAITNCLNFGNPYKPEVYWQFKEAIKGLGEACLVFDTPVTGGNVSFYNESPETSVFPTPVIGMLGIIEKSEHIMTSYFKAPNDSIVVLGPTNSSIQGSEYLNWIHGICAHDAPDIDLHFEKQLQLCCLKLIYTGLIQSMHDISDGGLAVCLIESAINGPTIKGFDVDLNMLQGRNDFLLFSEDQSRVIASVNEVHIKRIQECCQKFNVPMTVIGKVNGTSFGSFKGIGKVDLEKAKSIYTNTLDLILDK